jgi:CheY-like chemotaxis protein
MAPKRSAALVVENQPFVGLVASDILEEIGLETFHAFAADEALSLLRSHPEIELLVTAADLSGPVDGVELSRRVSAERPDVRMVITAGTAGQPVEVPAGARFLQKPYTSAELRALAGAKPQLLDA